MTQLTNTVRQHREQKNITQEQLAQALGVSRQTIIAIEKGNYEPSLGLGLKIARYFKLRIEDIFELH
jgi:putative transcriptional regulator